MVTNRLLVRAANVFLLGLLAAGCGSGVVTDASEGRTGASDPRGGGSNSRSADDDGEWSWSTPEPISLETLMEAGHLRVEAGTEGRTEVSVQPSDPERRHDVETAEETTVRMQDETLTIETPQRPVSWDMPGSIEVRVVLPADSDVNVRVSIADVETTGRLDRVELKSSAGDLNVDQAAEAVLGTAAGAVRVGHAAGPVEIGTSGGDVTVEEAAASVSAETTSGDVVVEEAADSVSAQTTGGAIRLGSVRRGEVVVGSTGGDIHIGVADGVPAWLDVDSLGGQVRPRIDPVSEADDAAVTIRAHSTGGDIDVAPGR